MNNPFLWLILQVIDFYMWMVIIGVVLRWLTALSVLTFDVQYDRGKWTGPNSWDGTHPPNDLLGVIQQIGHSCA